MANYDFDIGIIGGGSGGLTVAAGAAQFGAKTLLVEKGNELGGDCLHFGCVPSKTLIRTAHVYHFMRNSKAYGLPSVELPPVDYREVKKRIQSVIITIQKHDSEERFCSLGAKVAFGSPRFSDEHTILLNGKVKLSTLASAVHLYPTLGEINKRVAGALFSPKIFSDKVKKGLKFFFHLKGRACEPKE